MGKGYISDEGLFRLHCEKIKAQRKFKGLKTLYELFMPKILIVAQFKEEKLNTLQGYYLDLHIVLRLIYSLKEIIKPLCKAGMIINFMKQQ